jgi:two-component sensor histidine kinase
MNGQPAELVTDIDDIQLNMDQAVSVGLIINELVSNALKHGFPLNRAGQVQVCLKRLAAGRCALTVRDNGVGLPIDAEVSQPTTLGLQLVQDLVQQLHGEMSITRHGGAAFTISFDADSPTAVLHERTHH